MVAYVNIGSYYIIGLPLGILLGWFFNLGVLVRPAYISFF
jgi:MATE family multidrug resistance protein